MLARLMEAQKGLSLQARMGGRLNETLPYAYTSIEEKAAPPALSPKPDNLVSPHMSLTLFKLLP